MFTIWFVMDGDKEFVHFFALNLLFYGNSLTASLLLHRNWTLQRDERTI